MLLTLCEGREVDQVVGMHGDSVQIEKSGS